MRLVVLGPPGAGKGTQAARLAVDLGVPHIATGDMFRSVLRSDSPLGAKLRSYIDRGELVPDELTNEMLEHRLGEPDAAKGYVLDGYPRNVDQAEELEKFLADQGTALEMAVKFAVTGAEIVARLAGRRICPVCGTAYHVVSNPPRVPGICDVEGAALVQRADDAEETVLHRLEVYGAQTKPLYDFYAERGILKGVDALGSPEEVYRRLAAVVTGGSLKESP